MTAWEFHLEQVDRVVNRVLQPFVQIMDDEQFEWWDEWLRDISTRPSFVRHVGV